MHKLHNRIGKLGCSYVLRHCWDDPDNYEAPDPENVFTAAPFGCVEASWHAWSSGACVYPRRDVIHLIDVVSSMTSNVSLFFSRVYKPVCPRWLASLYAHTHRAIQQRKLEQFPRRWEKIERKGSDRLVVCFTVYIGPPPVYIAVFVHISAAEMMIVESLNIDEGVWQEVKFPDCCG